MNHFFKTVITFSIFFHLSFLSAFEIESLSEYAYMDAIAVQADTDKGSFYHDYTRVYSNYFKDLRDQPIRFLEIGIYKGNSVKLWETYFSQAELHFIDINKQYIEYYSSRSHYHYVNQENIKDLQKFARSVDGKFDVIIDDGGHTMKQQINSLKALFPYVKSGGMYIIEDIHTSYWKDWDKHYGSNTTNPLKAESGTTIDFLKGLIDSVNAVGAKSTKANYSLVPANIESNLTFWEKNVRSMHFYDSICIIIKR